MSLLRALHLYLLIGYESLSMYLEKIIYMAMLGYAQMSSKILNVVAADSHQQMPQLGGGNVRGR